MNEQSRDEKIIIREDWISRFFGYLGSFRYLRSRRDGKAVFLDELKSLTNSSKALKKQNKSTSDEENKADNIVYIYGNLDDGKSTYVDLLEQELIDNGQYPCVRCRFAQNANEVAVDRIAEEIRDAFAKKIDYATFPFMNLAAKGSEDKVDGYNLIKAAWEFFHDKNVFAARDLASELKKLMKPSDQVEAQSKIFSAQFEAVLDTCADDKEFENLVADNPYLFLTMDLWGIIECYPEEQFICIIDDFERFINRLVKFQGEEDEKKINRIMNMMKNMSDIVWVLISNEKPSENIKQHIKPQNAWHMKGLDENRTKEYVQLMWTPVKYPNEKVDDINEKWLEKVYEKTGGYISLINLCIRRETQVEGQSNFYNWVTNYCIPRDIQRKRISEEVLDDDEIMSARYEQYVNDWFKDLWNGNYKIGGMAGESVEDVFLTREFCKAPREETDQEVNMYIPALCYLIKKSKDHKGTIKQYAWDKKEDFLELTIEAKACIHRIAQECMFCLEYTEYPDIVFLDETIIDIMMQHKKFKLWGEIFDHRGFQKTPETMNNYKSSEIVGLTPEEVQDLKAMREVYILDKSKLDKSIGIKQSYHRDQSANTETIDNSLDNEELDAGIAKYDSSEDAASKEAQLVKDGVHIEGQGAPENKTVVEDEPQHQEADRIVQTENKTESEKLEQDDWNSAKN